MKKHFAPFEEELAASGVPYEIENGARHYKIKVGGRLCGILPRSGRGSTNRGILNVMAQVRRAIQEYKEGLT
jgi:hypothetical protein